MGKKTVWHTDIVIDGQGLGLKVASPSRGNCYRVELKPDTPGAAATRAKRKFLKAAQAEGVCFVAASSAKGQVERAVKKTRARWNKWHKEAYKK
jgi:hypothetical protein